MSGISAIVLSYQRPRMLRACLESVRANKPSEVIVADDGSTGFDLAALVREALPDVPYRLLVNAPLTVAARLVTPRTGHLVNKAYAVADHEIVAPICDDDLWHPGWLDAVRAFTKAHPGVAMVRGIWRAFNDSEPATPDCPPAALDGRGLTTGNFAHRRGLRGATWPGHTIASHDDVFLWSIQAGGEVDIFGGIPLIGEAGYRRLHRFNALHFAIGHGYGAGGEGFLSSEFLEPAGVAR